MHSTPCQSFSPSYLFRSHTTTPSTKTSESVMAKGSPPLAAIGRAPGKARSASRGRSRLPQVHPEQAANHRGDRIGRWAAQLGVGTFGSDDARHYGEQAEYGC